MRTLTAPLPQDAAPDLDPQRDTARTVMIDGLLQRGFPLMMFPRELEREFQFAGLPARRAHILKSGFISLLIFNVFLVADYLMLPDVFNLALTLRLLVFTPIALLFLLTFQQGRVRVLADASPLVLESIAMVSGLSAAAVLAFILASSNSPLAYLYHIGFMVVITYGNIVQRMRFWYAVAFSLALITLHVGGGLCPAILSGTHGAAVGVHGAGQRRLHPDRQLRA